MRIEVKPGDESDGDVCESNGRAFDVIKWDEKYKPVVMVDESQVSIQVARWLGAKFYREVALSFDCYVVGEGVCRSVTLPTSWEIGSRVWVYDQKMD